MAKEICESCTQKAPQMYEQGRLLFCIDENTGMQLLERKHPTLPAEHWGKPESVVASRNISATARGR